MFTPSSRAASRPPRRCSGRRPALYRADTSGPGALAPAQPCRCDQPRAARPCRQPALDRGSDAPRPPRRHRDRGNAGRAVRFCGHHGCCAEPAFRRLFRCDPRRRSRARASSSGENPAAARSMADKFEAALACGYWSTLRNSSRATLADIEAKLAERSRALASGSAQAQVIGGMMAHPSPASAGAPAPCVQWRPATAWSCASSRGWASLDARPGGSDCGAWRSATGTAIST